jgi:hypothetical protein
MRRDSQHNCIDMTSIKLDKLTTKFRVFDNYGKSVALLCNLILYCINNLSTICNTEFNKETRIRTFIYNIKKKLKLNKIKKRLKKK